MGFAFSAKNKTRSKQFKQRTHDGHVISPIVSDNAGL